MTRNPDGHVSLLVQFPPPEARAAARRLAARASRDPAVRFDRAIADWKLRGMMYQCRHGQQGA